MFVLLACRPNVIEVCNCAPSEVITVITVLPPDGVHSEEEWQLANSGPKLMERMSTCRGDVEIALLSSCAVVRGAGIAVTDAKSAAVSVSGPEGSCTTIPAERSALEEVAMKFVKLNSVDDPATPPTML